MAAAGGEERLAYACITHVPLALQFPPYVTPLYVGGAQADGQLNLRDLAPDWVPHHPVLGGTAGTFAVRRWLLRDHPDATRVGLCQYRKFVSRQRISQVAAKSYLTMDVTLPAQLPPERLAEVMRPGPEPFLLASLYPMWKTGCLAQYAAAHRAEDLLHFTAEAVAEGVLGGAESLAFLDAREMIPGGLEMGVYPAAFWLEQIAGVEAVVRRCIERHPVSQDGYQARAWAFCAERLGSWLLLRHLRRGRTRSRRVEALLRRWPNHWTHGPFGRLNLVADEANPDYVLGSMQR
jgi:hypothetical protein